LPAILAAVRLAAVTESLFRGPNVDILAQIGFVVLVGFIRSRFEVCAELRATDHLIDRSDNAILITVAQCLQHVF
jgi:hypothetical protein